MTWGTPNDHRMDTVPRSDMIKCTFHWGFTKIVAVYKVGPYELEVGL